MKKYSIKLTFYDPLRYRNYIFTETDMKNPAGEILFEGVVTRGRDYFLTYTESTLLKMGAKLFEQIQNQTV